MARDYAVHDAAPNFAVDRPTKIDTLPQAAAIFFRHLSPWLIFGTMIVAWSARALVGEWSVWDLAIAAGIAAFWPLQEWLIHVLVLHFKPRRCFGRTIDLHVAHKHRVHHGAPWILEHVFVPKRTLVVGLCLGVPLYILVASAFVPLARVLTSVAVFFTFGSLYEWMHFLIHTGYKPKTALYRRLWQNHRLHHFKNEHYWYGVSVLWGDRLLRTAPDPGGVERSATCRNLGILDESLDSGELRRSDQSRR